MHVRETITITSTQNTDGIVQVEEKSVRIIPGPAGIVQLAKIRKQSYIHEGANDSVLSTQEYMKQVVEDVGEDEDFNSGSWVGATEYAKANGGIVSGCLGDIKTFLKNGKLEQVVAIIKSCSPNALGDLKVTIKDLSVFSPNPSMHYLNITKKNVVKVFHKDFIPGNGSGVGGSGMLMEEEEIVKLAKEEEMADLELHVCENVIDQEDLYKFDEEALDLVLEEEAMKSRAHEEWLKKCRQQEEEDAEDERRLLTEGGGALGANKAITHPLGAVEAACALEVDAMGALDLVEVEAVGALDLVEVGAVGSSKLPKFAPPSESLTDAWLRMKEMVRNCHGHNLFKGNIIKIFYHGLSEITQEVLNAAAGGIFLYKTPNQAYQLLEDKVLLKLDWAKNQKTKPSLKKPLLSPMKVAVFQYGQNYGPNGCHDPENGCSV
ncbi:ribonuclease H-like domain-containing protein [Tanacetum coccineum]